MSTSCFFATAILLNQIHRLPNRGHVKPGMITTGLVNSATSMARRLYYQFKSDMVQQFPTYVETRQYMIDAYDPSDLSIYKEMQHRECGRHSSTITEVMDEINEFIEDVLIESKSMIYYILVYGLSTYGFIQFSALDGPSTAVFIDTHGDKNHKHDDLRSNVLFMYVEDIDDAMKYVFMSDYASIEKKYSFELHAHFVS